MSMRKPLKTDSLRVLKDIGVPMSWVVDVGVLTGTWELMTELGDRKHILLEPVVEWHEGIRNKYGELGIDFELLDMAVSDRDGEMQLEVTSAREGQKITHARLVDQPVTGQARTVTVRSLDSLLPELGAPEDFLLKIDVDGVEEKILAGAREQLDRCSVIIIEANVQNFAGRVKLCMDAGFSLFDIIDLCYYGNRLRQFDLVFLSDRVMKRASLDMYREKFDLSKWKPYLP